jgi:hypothetical protein
LVYRCGIIDALLRRTRQWQIQTASDLDHKSYPIESYWMALAIVAKHKRRVTKTHKKSVAII